MSAPPPARRHDVGGLAVTRRAHPDASVTVVLVHGAMDRSASFGRVMRRLGAGSTAPAMDVVAYDRRGYAGSLALGPGAGQALSAHAADLHAVAAWSAAGEFPRRGVVVVGHSLGGLIALLAAATWPLGAPPLRALAAYEPPPGGSMHGPSTPGGRALAAAASGDAAAAGESFLRDMLGDSTWERLRAADREARRAEGATLVEELRSMSAARLPEPGSLPVAPVIGRGTLTAEGVRRSVGRTAGALGVEVVDMPGAGHGAHLSHPDLFAGWVAGLGAASPAPAPPLASGGPIVAAARRR